VTASPPAGRRGGRPAPTRLRRRRGHQMWPRTGAHKTLWWRGSQHRRACSRCICSRSTVKRMSTSGVEITGRWLRRLLSPAHSHMPQHETSIQREKRQQTADAVPSSSGSASTASDIDKYSYESSAGSKVGGVLSKEGVEVFHVTVVRRFDGILPATLRHLSSDLGLLLVTLSLHLRRREPLALLLL